MNRGDAHMIGISTAGISLDAGSIQIHGSKNQHKSFDGSAGGKKPVKLDH